MMLGVRAHDFGKLPLEALARRIHAKEFNGIQLALSKAIDDMDTGRGRLSPGMANRIRRTLEVYGIRIVVLGCYINPIHPDPGVRKASLEYFKEHLRFVRDFGCSIVATETGSVRADGLYSSENHSEAAFLQLEESVGELVAEAEKFGVFVCVEGVTTHPLNTPLKIKRLLDRINSNNLQILFDPANLTPAEEYDQQERILGTAFDLFGERIMVMHAKDFMVEQGQKKKTVIGQGVMNYEWICRRMKEIKPSIDVLLEDTSPETMAESVRYISQVW